MMPTPTTLRDLMTDVAPATITTVSAVDASRHQQSTGARDEEETARILNKHPRRRMRGRRPRGGDGRHAEKQAPIAAIITVVVDDLPRDDVVANNDILDRRIPLAAGVHRGKTDSQTRTRRPRLAEDRQLRAATPAERPRNASYLRLVL
mmetsp:Transcript_20998/g.83730  ORF Transcript_20998/g.83730 Transcript_20998/m.83730 type:complete len:149 (-) Transcript_20998:546-992(-)